jgi:hypothetical protein
LVFRYWCLILLRAAIKKGLRFVVRAFSKVIVPFERFVSEAEWGFYPIRY